MPCSNGESETAIVVETREFGAYGMLTHIRFFQFFQKDPYSAP